MTLPEGVRRLLRLRDEARELDEELAYHFDRTVEELVSQGRSRESAEREARARFGDERQWRRELASIDREAASRRRWSERSEAAGELARSAVRSVARSPGLSLGIVLAFALGIGANATMFGIVERLLLKPPAHIQDAERLRRVYVEQLNPFIGEPDIGSSFSYPAFLDLGGVAAFDGIAAYRESDIVVGRGASVQEIRSVHVTGNWFELLGVRPALGRFFGASEESVGGARVAVLGHGYWQRAHGGRADAIGRTIDFGYGPYEVIGVAPQGFTGVDLAQVDVWLPLRVVAGQTQGTEWYEEPAGRSWQWIRLIARLNEGVTTAAAQSEATARFVTGHRVQIEAGDIPENPEVLLSSVMEAAGPGASGESVVAKLLLAVSLVVLLIACVNVANLLLARTLRRRRDVAVRLALGISRRRLIGQMVLEGIVLALLGGAAALLVAAWGGSLLRNVLLPGVYWSDGTISPGMLWMVIAVSVVAGIFSALIPALQAARGDVADTMRQAGAGGVTRGAARVRTSLALAQTALSVLLLVGAGLFVRSLDRVRSVDLGFDAENLYYASARAPRESFDSLAILRLYEEGRERLAALPGVRAAGVTSTLPYYSRRSVYLRAEGVDSIPRPASGGPFVHEVSEGYFEAMDLALLRGRTFTSSDGTGPRVAIVNASMARALWPDRDPLGMCLYVSRQGDASPPCSRVVGVVEDVRETAVTESVSFQYYVPLAQRQVNARPSLFVIRTTGRGPAIASQMRSAIVDLDTRVRYATVEPMSTLIDPQLRSWTLGATMLGVFGILALVVAAIGLYSVLSFDVAQRTRELGVRAALGAGRNRLLGLVVRRALGMTTIGVAAGGVAALVLVQRVETMLFEIPPRDPATFAAVIVLLHMVAAVASAVPGWRAARVAPNQALRAE